MTPRFISDKDLDAAVADLHAALAAKPMAGGLPAIDFCKQWPIAKAILEVLAKVPALGWIVQLLIMVGDAYAKKHCPVG